MSHLMDVLRMNGSQVHLYKVGVDAGEFSREFMSNSVTAIQDEPKGSIDPVRVLEKAHSSTKSQGSSTACIISLTEEGWYHRLPFPSATTRFQFYISTAEW